MKDKSVELRPFVRVTSETLMIDHLFSQTALWAAVPGVSGKELSSWRRVGPCHPEAGFRGASRSP